MKNLLKIALLTVVAIVAGACDNEEEVVQTPEMIINSHFNDLISESEAEGLNPEEFPSILGGKSWHDAVCVRYGADWSNPKVIYATINGEMIVPIAPGLGISYEFYPDGTGLYYINAVPEDNSLTWSWDPASMTLEIDHASDGCSKMQIQLFTKDSFIGYQRIIRIDSKTGEQHPYIEQTLFVMGKEL